MITEEREVLVFCWEKPPHDYYSGTTAIILPYPPTVLPVRFSYTVSTPSRNAKRWNIDAIQIRGPVPSALLVVPSDRLLTQLRYALRTAIQEDMLHGGLLENKSITALPSGIINLEND